MKKIQILFITTWLFGCSTSVSVDTPKSQNFQEYYQFKLISGIKIPEKHKVQEPFTETNTYKQP